MSRFVADAEDLGHFPGGFAFKVAEQNGVTVGFAEFTQGGVEMRGDILPDDVGFGGKQFVHGGSLLFAGATAHIGANKLARGVLRRAMQPAGYDGMIRELPSILCKGHKHSLGHVPSEMRVTNHPDGGGINQINVPAHEFGESGFGLAFRVIPQKLLVCLVVHSRNSTRPRSNRTGKGGNPLLRCAVPPDLALKAVFHCPEALKFCKLKPTGLINQRWS